MTHSDINTDKTKKESDETSNLKIDNKDKEILRLLNDNARMTSKAIGASVNISREVADYRIKRLVKNGLISRYITVINDNKLGFEAYVLLLQLQNYTTEDEKRILNFLDKHHFVKWVLKCSGDWDIQTTVIARNKIHLAEIIDEIDNYCGKNLRKYDLEIVVKLLVPENLSFMLPPAKQKEIPPADTAKLFEIAEIDDKDKKLMKALATDARAPIVKIAQQIGLSADATNLRIKKLVKKDVIKKFQTVVDLSTLAYLRYSVFLKVNNYSEKRGRQIQTFLYSLPNITFSERIIGNWDLRMQISCMNPQEFENLLQKIREFLGEDLKYYNFALMLKEYKRVSYTEGMQ